MPYMYSMKRQLLDNQIKVQVSIPIELRDDLAKHAKQMGFESIQHFTKVLFQAVINNLPSPSNMIAGTHVTEADIEEYRRSRLHAAYLRDKKNLDYH